MGFYPRGKRGTMRGPHRFNPMASSIKLFRAVRGMAADKQAITEVLAYHTAYQRRELKNKYRYVYKKELAEVLDAGLSFSFGKIVAALMAEPEDYVLECLHRTLTPKSTGKKMVRRLSQIFSNGLGKDEYLFIDLLCHKSNEYLEAIKTAYKEKYNEDLNDKLSCDDGNLLPSDFRNIIQDMLACERDESEPVDMEQINEDVDDIMDPDSEEVALQAIFQERSYPHIRRLAVEYRKKAGKTLQTLIEEGGKFSQDQKSTYLAIFSKIRNEHQFYAERLRIAIDGMGRDDDTLIRIVVLRSEIDLLDIMEAYKDKYNIDLQINVAKETSGEYKEMLMRIIRVPDENEPMVVDPADVHMNAEELKRLSLDETRLKALMEDGNGVNKDGLGDEEEEEEEEEEEDE